MGVIKVRRIAVMLLAACVAGCGSATNLDTATFVMATGKQAAWTGGGPAAGADVETTGSIKQPDVEMTGSIKPPDVEMTGSIKPQNPDPPSMPFFYHFLGLY